MKTVGTCVVCDDPIYDFQAIEMEGKFIPLHEGCVRCLSEILRGRREVGIANEPIIR